MIYQNTDMNAEFCDIMKWTRDLGTRDMYVSPNYAYYGNLSSILIQWEGSPPKATLLGHKFHGYDNERECMDRVDFFACNTSGYSLRKVGNKQRDRLKDWIWQLITQLPIQLNYKLSVDYNDDAEVAAAKAILQSQKQIDEAVSELLLIRKLKGKQ